MHSKLRNASAKGRATRTTTSTTTSTTSTTTTTTATSSGINNTNSSSNSGSNTSNNTPSTSPTAFLPPRAEKRKSKDDSPPPSFNGSDSNGSNSGSATTQSVINPVTGLNVQIPTKKIKTATPCAISPVLLECPEQDCSKKYKHANGLKYHQSHAHGAGSMDEDSQQLPESPHAHPPSTPSPSPPTPQPTQSISQPPTPGAQIPQANTTGSSAQRSRTPTPPIKNLVDRPNNFEVFIVVVDI